MSILKNTLNLFQEKEEDVKKGDVNAALKTEENDTPLINWSAPTYQKTVFVLITLNVICLICGCLYEVFRRKFFKQIKNKIKPESIRMNNKFNSIIIDISLKLVHRKNYLIKKLQKI